MMMMWGESLELQKRLISAKKIQAEYKISLSTINYYTNIGMLPVASRRGNVRLYDPEEVRTRMNQIHKLKNDGYPLRLIQKIL